MKSLGTLLVLSGANALFLELLFFRLATLHFGSTHRAAGITLAGFFAGLLIGAKISGRFVRRIQRPFVAFGILELVLGIQTLLLTIFFPPAMSSVLHFLRSYLPETLASLLAGLVATAFVLPATAAAGASFPVVMKAAVQLSRRGSESAPLLYALNTFGAAAGVFLGLYFLVPLLGYDGLALIVAMNGTLILAISISRGWNAGTPANSLETNHQLHRRATPLSRVHLLVAFLSGVITFSYETVWTHILALVAGSSVYAFAMMLVSFLLALALASKIVDSWIAHRVGARIPLTYLAGAVVALVSLQTYLWNFVPLLFERAAFARSSFVLSEMVRGSTTWLMVSLPALAIGLLYPSVLREALADTHDVPEVTARMSIWSSLGCIVGALLATFVCIPLFGARGTVAFTSLFVVSLLFVDSRDDIGSRRRWQYTAAFIFLALLPLLTPWNLNRLLSGANVYFSSGFQKADEVLFMGEDSDTGVTAVVRSGTTRMMTTNGKFQGNDSFEMNDQRFFALVPSLLARQHTAALNIGLGTGVTLAALARFPYRTIEAAELSPRVVEAAHKYFLHVNEGVLNSPRTTIWIEDGRTLLSMPGPLYDVISVELQSVWVRGSGNLYSREFYELCKRRLRPGGVLQQWIHLHHIRQEDILTILATIKASFPEVTLWILGHQGVIAASDGTFRPTREQLKERLSMVPEVSMRSVEDLKQACLLSTRNIETFLVDQIRGKLRPRDVISTDLNPLIEFGSPRGVAMGYNLKENLAYLSEYRFLANSDLVSEPTRGYSP